MKTAKAGVQEKTEDSKTPHHSSQTAQESVYPAASQICGQKKETS